MQAPNVQLQPGSTDTANIKKLQDYLVSKGLMTQAQVNTGYGIYGPQTTEAVAKLQKQLGVDTSAGGIGYYGPLTSAAVTKSSSSSNPTSGSFGPTSSWNVSNWNSNYDSWTNQPTLTVDGKTYKFDTPQEYASMLQKMQQAGVGGDLGSRISEFNNAQWKPKPVDQPAQQPAPQQTQTPAPQQTQPVVTQQKSTPTGTAVIIPTETRFGSVAGQKLYPDGSVYSTNGDLISGPNESWSYTYKNMGPSWQQNQPAAYNPFTTPTPTQTPAPSMGTVNVNGSQVTGTTTPNGTTTPTTTGTTPGSTTAPAGNGGYNFGEGNTLTQEEFDALDKSYYDEQSPFYDAQQNYELAKYGADDNKSLTDYDLSLRDYQARAQEDYDTLNDNEGKNGTWASSERLKRRNNLQDKYNRSYEGIYNTASNNLYNNRLATAYDYGDNSIANNSPIQKYGVTFGDTPTASTNTLGSGGAYNPFGFQGRRNVERKNTSRLAAINQLDTFNYNTKFTTQ